MLGFRHESLEKDGVAFSDAGGAENKESTPRTAVNTKLGTPEQYWIERKKYLEKIKNVPELRKRFLKSIFVYLLRRFLWSFGFFPIFISFWLPLVLNRFNPVAMVSSLLPSLEGFVNSNPQAQANTMDTLFIAWFSIGFIFAIFDFVLTPYKSPYEYEADVHMRAWEELQNNNDKLQT
jgi:hypothetical protein